MGRAGYRSSGRLDKYAFNSISDRPKLTRNPSNRAEKRRLAREVRIKKRGSAE